MTKQYKTSWESSSKWYDSVVGKGGHYYHEQVIFPQLLKLIDSRGWPEYFLDLACGQGVLSRKLKKNTHYLGVDLAQSLIKEARKRNQNPNSQFVVGDITKPLKLEKGKFDQGCILLALQNLENPKGALENMSCGIRSGGTLYLVLNHPCFRIPRMSHWGEDLKKKLQYRRMDAYMSSQKIPIQTHPSKGGNSEQTWTFHHPLSSYSQWLGEAGFMIEAMHEWTSDKVSSGPKAKMENRARREFPLFLALVCKKS